MAKKSRGPRKRVQTKGMVRIRQVDRRPLIEGYDEINEVDTQLRAFMEERQRILHERDADVLVLENRVVERNEAAEKAVAGLVDSLSPLARKAALFLEANREKLTTTRRKSSHKLRSGDVVKWSESDTIDIPKPAAFVAEALTLGLARTMLRKIFAPAKSEKLRKHLDDLARMTTGRNRRERKVTLNFPGIRDKLEVAVDLDTNETHVRFVEP